MSENMEASYLARIAELEEEVRTLRAELARYMALDILGVGGLANRPKPGSLGADLLTPIPPSHVTADGSQGMRRGVSDGRSRSAGDADAKEK